MSRPQRPRHRPLDDLFKALAASDEEQLQAAGYTCELDAWAPFGYFWRAPDGTGRLSTDEALARVRTVAGERGT